MAVSSIHSGWQYDPSNSRLNFYYRGTRVGHISSGGDLAVTSGTVDVQDGGTVSQGSGAKTTGVTLNTNSGQITMDDAALAGAAEVTFAVTNSQVAATDVVIVNHGSAGTAGAYVVQANTMASGSFKITAANLSTNSLSEAIVINFVVIKGASS